MLLPQAGPNSQLVSAPDELSAAQLEKLGSDLRRLEVELATAIERSADEGKPVDLDEPIGRLSRMDAIAQRAVGKASREQQRLHLGQVRQAIDAIESGDYGLCRVCDEPIPFRRLEARPHSLMCIRCQSERERG